MKSKAARLLDYINGQYKTDAAKVEWIRADGDTEITHVDGTVTVYFAEDHSAIHISRNEPYGSDYTFTVKGD